MSYPRLLNKNWLGDIWSPGSEITLEKSEQRYLLRVLRLKEGAEVELCDGQTKRWLAELKFEGREVIAVLKTPLPELPSPYPVILIQGVPKGERFDYTLQKGTEVGIERFIPALTERTIVELKTESKVKKRLERWNKITAEAAKQSRRLRIPEVERPKRLEDILKELPANFEKVVCWEGERECGFKSWLEEKRFNPPAGVAVFIGPEGGFSDSEIALLKGAGVISLSLGPLILRSETAGVIAAALIQYTFGILGEPLFLSPS